MASLKLIDEIGINDTLLTLEPSYRCDCRCTWCYAELNRKAKQQDTSKVPDTFASLVSRAFGPDYDPTDFRQYALHERLPINYAAGVEPWQDLPQARAILDVGERLGLSFTFQSRGLNWREVWPQLRSFVGSSYLLVSLATDRPAIVKRYEPGTPSIEERLALIDAAVGVGMPVMVSVAPYHREWIGDLAGFAEGLARRGVGCVFCDPLHLSRDQLGAATDPDLARLIDSAWSDESIDQIAAARMACVEAGISWECTSNRAWLEGVESVGDLGWHGLPRVFPYTHYALLDALVGADDSTDDPDSGPILIEWETARAITEAHRRIDQPFKWSVLRPAFRILQWIDVAWQERLKPTATFREYLRCLWNRPCYQGVFWSNPFIRSAVRPDGEPWRSDTGDLVLSFDPRCESGRNRQAIESLEGQRFLSLELAEA